MSKRIDFAKQRRDQGRSLISAVREIKATMEPIAHQSGIDLRAILNEGAARKEKEKQLLTERLQESVVPLFIYRDGQPDRVGSCVLVRSDSQFYAFTAAHVIRDAGSAKLFAPSEGRGGKLQPLPPYTAHLKSSRGNNDSVYKTGALARSVGVNTNPSGTAGVQGAMQDVQNPIRSLLSKGLAAKATKSPLFNNWLMNPGGPGRRVPLSFLLGASGILRSKDE
jgi:hypothetical protein